MILVRRYRPEYTKVFRKSGVVKGTGGDIRPAEDQIYLITVRFLLI